MKKCLVLMSTFNGEKHIKEQIDSIFNQKGDIVIKLLIRDDGSTDKTNQLIREYILNGFQIELIEGNNIGFVASFMSLVDLAFQNKSNYDFFLLSDQDDVWMNDKVIAGIKAIENINSNYCLYCSSSLPVNEDLTLIKYKKKKYRVDPYSSVVQTFSAGHTYIFKSGILDFIHNCDSTRMYTHDGFIFTISCLLGQVIYDESPHVFYRQYSNNQLGTSNRTLFKYLKERFKRLKRGDFKKYATQIQYIYDLKQYLLPIVV